MARKSQISLNEAFTEWTTIKQADGEWRKDRKEAVYRYLPFWRTIIGGKTIGNVKDGDIAGLSLAVKKNKTKRGIPFSPTTLNLQRSIFLAF